MCMYCERRKDIKYGWKQPSIPIYDENSPNNEFSVMGNIVEKTMNVVIHDYQTSQPKIIVTSSELATAVFGGNGGVATIYIPANYCFVCGRKLGSK